MTKVPFRTILVAFGLAVAVASATTVHASAYPTNQCVGDKQKAASAKCAAVLKAWAAWETKQDDAARDAAFSAAADKFSAAWTKAETKASGKGVDCAQTTDTAANVEMLIDNEIAAIVAAVNAGLSLPADGKCGATILKAAAKKCQAFLKAESGYITKLAAGKDKRDQTQSKATTKFSDSFAKAAPCPTTATAGSIETLVDNLVADVVTSTTVSPSVDDTQFTTISPTGVVSYQGRNLTPICALNTPYAFFVKRGSVNKLVMYYQGGGACWDKTSCQLPTCDQDVNPAGSDNPNNSHTGFADLSNPDNPFKDWNIVFTSYCTCDIHFGDTSRAYAVGFGVQHVGYENARVVEKWAREHFVNPDEIVVTGSSAGAYGALFNAPILETVWPDSKFSVLADAGNGVITSDFLNTAGYGFQNWNFEANLPTYIPGVLESIQSGAGMPAYTEAVAAYFPKIAWANYTTAYDGGTGGQTGFYNVMLNPGNALAWASWWNASCAWHENMVNQAVATAAAVTNNNYRYYIGRGSRHTGYGSDAVVYSPDTLNGNTLPALKDWVNSMRARDGGWVNQECLDCETLRSGDPQPNPLAPPFVLNGTDVEVSCP